MCAVFPIGNTRCDGARRVRFRPAADIWPKAELGLSVHRTLADQHGRGPLLCAGLGGDPVEGGFEAGHAVEDAEGCGLSAEAGFGEAALHDVDLVAEVDVAVFGAAV